MSKWLPLVTFLPPAAAFDNAKNGTFGSIGLSNLSNPLNRLQGDTRIEVRCRYPIKGDSLVLVHCLYPSYFGSRTYFLFSIIMIIIIIPYYVKKIDIFRIIYELFLDPALMQRSARTGAYTNDTLKLTLSQKRKPRISKSSSRIDT